MLWILRTGAPWKDLPRRYGAYQTCHRRLQQWQRSGVLDAIQWALCEELMARGKLDLSQSLVDASFRGGEKGSDRIGPTRCGKGRKIMAIADGSGIPVAVGLRALRRMSPRWSSPRSTGTKSAPCRDA